MNNLDVSGLLKTYSGKCAKARSDEQLKNIVRELKQELNSNEIKKLKILKNDGCDYLRECERTGY